MKPTIIAPDDAVLVDERISISIEHLAPFQRCTVRAELRSEKNEIFESFAQFMADYSGEVNLEKDSSFGGTYVGSDGMGLFWSMAPAPGQRKGLRYTARNLHSPIKFNLQLFDGHTHKQNGEEEDGKILATKTVLRTYLFPNVERIEVNVGRLRGTLFVPKAKPRFPGRLFLHLSNSAQFLQAEVKIWQIYGLPSCIVTFYMNYDVISS